MEDLQKLRETLEAQKRVEFEEMEEKLRKAEDSHQHVLDQFEAYKLSLSEELARKAREEQAEVSAKSKATEKTWAERLDSERNSREAETRELQDAIDEMTR